MNLVTYNLLTFNPLPITHNPLPNTRSSYGKARPCKALRRAHGKKIVFGRLNSRTAEFSATTTIRARGCFGGPGSSHGASAL